MITLFSSDIRLDSDWAEVSAQGQEHRPIANRFAFETDVEKYNRF